MGKFAIVNNPETQRAALKLAKGRYQRDILLGNEAISGSTLRGTARNYGGRYRRSAESVIARCMAAGLAVDIRIMEHGRLTVCFD
ncbi:MAG: hypothetical protein M0R06_18075 [Sphaerochaeta sp.]|jgi:hypothetical protein|nr:hypothetical protein [Sphaerochaeta sp.]